jgi:hypothetical protein
MHTTYRASASWTTAALRRFPLAVREPQASRVLRAGLKRQRTGALQDAIFVEVFTTDFLLK